MVEKLNSDREVAAVDRRFFKSIGSIGRICQDSCLPPSYLRLAFATLADCGAACRLIVVRPDLYPEFDKVYLNSRRKENGPVILYYLGTRDVKGQ